VSPPYYSAQQVQQAAAWQRQNIQAGLNEAAALDVQHHAAREEVQKQLETATSELGRTLLPDLSPASLARAVALTGYATLQTDNLPGRMAAEKAQLERRRAEIDADPRFARRELLMHPRTGSLPRQLAEIEDLKRPWDAVMAGCTSHPRFTRLIESGWGTDAYEGGWWRVSYWKDHSAAADVLKVFPEAPDFNAVRAQYVQACDTLQKLGSERDRLKAEIAACESLEAEHARIANALWTLKDRWLAAARDHLLRHVATVPPAVLEPRIAAEPNVRVMLLRAGGLAAKVVYLDGLHREKVEKTKQDLMAQDAKMAAVASRFARKPVNMPAAEFQKKFVDRREKVQKSFTRYRSLSSRVYTYDRWHETRYYDDILWWDVMMGGRVDGGFLPEVDSWHRHHPGYQYSPPIRGHREVEVDDDRIETDANAAVAGVASSGGDGLHARDAS
jgi:hypothetical protein